MKYRYTVKAEVDTNDADYIREDYSVGVFDDTNEADMKHLQLLYLALCNFNVEDGYNCTVDNEDFFNSVKEYGLKFSDDKNLDKDVAAELDSLLEQQFKDLSEEDVEAIEEYCKEAGDQFTPWMDNCDCNHDWSFDMIRYPLDFDPSVSLEDLVVKKA